MIQLKKEPLILLADDNPENLKIMSNILKQTNLNAKIIAVPNGKIMLDIALQKLPDLIITDWEMPMMNGLEAIIELKKNEMTKDIPIIMCTGIMTTPSDLKTSMEAGAVDYVRKPIESMELVARVQSMLQLSASYLKIKEQNQEIQTQKKELEQLNNIKDKIFSIIAHDLRSPFNTLTGLLSLMEIDPSFPTEFKPLGKEIQEKVAVLNDTLNNMLHWAMSQMEGESSKKEKIPLQEVLENKKKLFKNIAEQKNIDLFINCPSNVYLWADINHIRAIFRNLINNAIKFTHINGKVIIEVSEKNSKILIAVKDTGVGMPPEKLKNLFNSLGNNSTLGTNNEKGTGLGLLICKDFVQKNQGKLYVESTENEGTTFYIEMPIYQENM